MTATVKIPVSVKYWALPLGAIVLALAHSNANADETWTYSVEISATAQVSPPQITLHWENDDIYGVTNFTIYRKGKNGTSWNYLTSLDGSTFSWSDPNVSVGATYEYQIFKGAAQLNLEHGLKLSEYFGFNDLETEYFLALIQKDRAGTAHLKAHFGKQIGKLREKALNLSQRFKFDKELDEKLFSKP